MVQKKRKRRLWRKKKHRDVELTEVPPKSVDEMKQEVDEIRNVLYENMVKIKDREGKLEDLVEKGEILEENAAEFQKVGKKLRRRMWLRQHKLKIVIIVAIVLAVVAIVILCVCFATGIIAV